MIDKKDKEILDILQKQGRISNADLARSLGMAPSGVHERVRKLERQGVIEQYSARIAPKTVGLTLTTFIQVKTDDLVGCTDAGHALARLPEVLEVHHIAGEFNYLLKARVADTDSLTDLLKAIGRISHVRDTRTTLVLGTIKESTVLQIREDDSK
ncbi:MAG TPA: Lrp/AsnC family transcriptional regulator [Desulfomicrobiaceae bacterium]|jgi:Lrp/AsnC family leucine-responsive transcriptional regulator|nr:Lrp/AsnC family transcriptional regulator [Desulfomicrobiaceae bacterium]